MSLLRGAKLGLSRPDSGHLGYTCWHYDESRNVLELLLPSTTDGCERSHSAWQAGAAATLTDSQPAAMVFRGLAVIPIDDVAWQAKTTRQLASASAYPWYEAQLTTMSLSASLVIDPCGYRRAETMLPPSVLSR